MIEALYYGNTDYWINRISEDKQIVLGGMEVKIHTFWTSARGHFKGENESPLPSCRTPNGLRKRSCGVEE